MTDGDDLDHSVNPNAPKIMRNTIDTSQGKNRVSDRPKRNNQLFFMPKSHDFYILEQRDLPENWIMGDDLYLPRPPTVASLP